jgi:hypothetical protein
MIKKRALKRLKAYRDTLDGYARKCYDLDVMYAEAVAEAPQLTGDQDCTLDWVAQAGCSRPAADFTYGRKRDLTLIQRKGAWVELCRDHRGVLQVCLTDMARWYYTRMDYIFRNLAEVSR